MDIAGVMFLDHKYVLAVLALITAKGLRNSVEVSFFMVLLQEVYVFNGNLVLLDLFFKDSQRSIVVHALGDAVADLFVDVAPVFGSALQHGFGHVFDLHQPVFASASSASSWGNCPVRSTRTVARAIVGVFAGNPVGRPLREKVDSLAGLEAVLHPEAHVVFVVIPPLHDH